MPTPSILLLALANSPHVLQSSRSILSALISHCTDHTALSNFLFASLLQRVHALRAEGFSVLCDCGCGELVEPDPWEEQSEALNEEMSSWLADFILIPIGKRKVYLKKLVWYNNWCGELEGTEADGRTTEWIKMRDLEYQVLQRNERSHGRTCALTGRVEDITIAQVIPVSQDPERFDRFVQLANVFFSGGYAESLTQANIFSTRNAFMLHASWLIVLDHGDLIFKHFEDKVYAVGVTYETHARLRFMASYDFQAGGVPIDVPSNALDSGLMELHANITRLWLEIDLSRDIVAEIDSLENMPTSLQEVHSTTPESFDNILRHKLMLL